MKLKLIFTTIIWVCSLCEQLTAQNQDNDFSFELNITEGALNMTSIYGTTWNTLMTYNAFSKTHYVSNFGVFSEEINMNNSTFLIKARLRKENLILEGLQGTNWDEYEFDCPDKDCEFIVSKENVKIAFKTSNSDDQKVNQKIKELEAKRAEVEKEEKAKLKSSIAKISKDEKLSQKSIDSLKMDLAEKTAKNIENQLAIIDNSIAYFERNHEDVGLNFEDEVANNAELKINIGGWKLFSITEKSEISKAYNPKTTSSSRWTKITSENRDSIKSYRRISDDFLVLGLAFNNAMPDGGSIDNTGIRFAGSRSLEIGYARDFRVFEKSNWLRIKYGVSLQMNGLKPKGNRIFETDGTQTTIEQFDSNLRKNKFRMDNLIFPVHFQIGKSEAKLNQKTGNVHFSDHDFKFGIGGFVGLNLLNTQKLKYTDDLGINTRERQRNDFNTNNILYGLSTYIGWEEFSIFAQYNINPIFRNSPIDMNNFQIGVRFDFN